MYESGCGHSRTKALPSRKLTCAFVIVRSTTGSRSMSNSRAAWIVTPPPHGLSRGKPARSSITTLAPERARRRAAVLPAGPAPITIASYSVSYAFTLSVYQRAAPQQSS